MSKYESLWRYVLDNKKDLYELSFYDIRNILGFDIDHSFLMYKKELANYSYEVVKISMKNKIVYISKIK